MSSSFIGSLSFLASFPGLLFSFSVGAGGGWDLGRGDIGAAGLLGCGSVPVGLLGCASKLLVAAASGAFPSAAVSFSSCY